MGQGLGKNTPVVLTLGRDNYEALIARHGQWVRWRVATKCPCVGKGGHPDLHCPKCAGLGVTYGIQPSADVSETVFSDGTGVVEVSGEYKDATLIRVYDDEGREYPGARKVDQYISLGDKIAKGSYITITMRRDTVKSRDAVLTYLGAGYYQVEGLTVSNPSLVSHSAPCDLVEVKISGGGNYRALELRQDKVLVEGDGWPQELRARVKYVEPFVFVILNQELSKADSNMMLDCAGDAVVSFPYCYDVAVDDVITVLSGAYTKKVVLTRKSGFDVIPSYFVNSVTACVGKEDVYKEGKDFILVGSNRIKWLRPLPQEPYSVTYSALPTYKVVKSIPQIRTSENQRMPKKAILKLYDTYGEARGVNQSAI